LQNFHTFGSASHGQSVPYHEPLHCSFQPHHLHPKDRASSAPFPPTLLCTLLPPPLPHVGSRAPKFEQKLIFDCLFLFLFIFATSLQGARRTRSPPSRPLLRTAASLDYWCACQPRFPRSCVANRPRSAPQASLHSVVPSAEIETICNPPLKVRVV